MHRNKLRVYIILKRSQNLFRLAKKNLILVSLYLKTKLSCRRKTKLSIKIKRSQKMKKPSQNLFWQYRNNTQSLLLCAFAHFLIMKSQRLKEVNLTTLLLNKTSRFQGKRLIMKSSNSKKSSLSRQPSLKFFSPSFNISISPSKA